jgi:hypothetical protein
MILKIAKYFQAQKMNINEFERNKPRVTKAIIDEAITLTDQIIKDNLSAKIYDQRIESLYGKLLKLREKFLLGE